MALLGSLVHGLVMYSMLLYLPLFFQAVFLQTPLQSAASMLILCSLLVAFNIIASITMQLFRRYKLQLQIGWALTTLGMGLLCTTMIADSRARTDGVQALVGIGIGIVFSTTAIPMQASVVNIDDSGLAAGLLVAFRIFGAVIGLAVGSSAFNTTFQRHIASFGPLTAVLHGLEDARHAISFIPALRDLDVSQATLENVVDTYRLAFQTVWIAITCFAGVGLLTSLLIRELDIEKENYGRQRMEQSSQG